MLHQQMVVCLRKQVLHKLTDIEVIGDEVVDLLDLAIPYLLPDVFIALSAFYRLSPYLGGQGKSLWCLFIPMAATLQEVGLGGVGEGRGGGGRY